jgi:hypothetical protein
LVDVVVCYPLIQTLPQLNSSIICPELKEMWAILFSMVARPGRVLILFYAFAFGAHWFHLVVVVI